MALLAIPGSANFVGEFYILNGVFQEKIVFALIASIGVALAAYYALRLFQASMHNRKPEGVESVELRKREGAVIGALVACIVALALYPHLILDRAERSVASAIEKPACEAFTEREFDAEPDDPGVFCTVLGARTD
jgi:NADH-quinone oxidoreductase subunit M